MTFNLAIALHRRCGTDPHALALSCEGGELTYAQLARRAAGLARRLRAAAGAKAGHGGQPRIGVLGSRSAEAYVGVLGALWAGATYVPLGPKLPDERLLTLMELCDLSAIVADTEGGRRLSAKVLDAAPSSVFLLGEQPAANSFGGKAIKLDARALEAGGGDAPVEVRADDTAYIIFTSGTTGVPKGVMIPAAAACHQIAAMTELLGLRRSDRILETFELTFDVSVQNMFCAWEAGASLHVLPASRAMNAVRFAREHGLSVWISVPSMIGMLRQVKALGPGVMPGVRLTIFGGEQLPRAVVDAWRAAAPSSAIFNHYGPTEATVCCMSQLVGDPVPLTPGRDVVPIGTPLAGNEAAIFDDAGQEMPDDCAGELAIAGPQLASGYLNARETSATRFPWLHGKRWYLTGDRALRDAAGVFHHLGRIDNQVKVLGHRIELEEIDAHLRIAADVDLAGTIAWPVENGSAQGLVAFVCNREIDEQRIMSALRERLPRYMVPNRVVPVDYLPLNANGKVDRQALRRLLDNGGR